MRYLSLLAIAALAFLAPGAKAQEREERGGDMHERARIAVERTDDDLQRFVHRENLSDRYRDRFEAAMKDLHEFRDAMARGHWDDGRQRLDRAIENIQFVADNARIGEHERDTLREDIRSLRDIREGWR
jgi:hypothetical protein